VVDAMVVKASFLLSAACELAPMPLLPLPPLVQEVLGQLSEVSSVAMMAEPSALEFGCEL
jgi:hypothetical protein